jgi:hypothetical protein
MNLVTDGEFIPLSGSRGAMRAGRRRIVKIDIEI